MGPEERAEVLLIDDSPADRLLIKNALKTTSWVKDVHVARDPDQAREILHHYGRYARMRTPDLIICDLHMPHGGGISVLNTLNSERRFRKLPVVMFSTTAETDRIGDCYGLGAKVYLRKPDDLDCLSRMMESLGPFWHRNRKEQTDTLSCRLRNWWHSKGSGQHVSQH